MACGMSSMSRKCRKSPCRVPSVLPVPSPFSARGNGGSGEPENLSKDDRGVVVAFFCWPVLIWWGLPATVAYAFLRCVPLPKVSATARAAPTAPITPPSTLPNAPAASPLAAFIIVVRKAINRTVPKTIPTASSALWRASDVIWRLAVTYHGSC
jgi:hypothetical protein